MAHKLSIPAFEIKQPGVDKKKAIYLATISASELIDETMFKVDFWEKELEGKTEQGYQRKINDSHARKISDFLFDSDAILPSSILMSTRESLPKFVENKIIIDDFPIYIVDGQHRVAGLRDAIQNKGLTKWKEAVFPVVILCGFSKFEEMVQFVELNTKQKKVSTDLAFELVADLAKDSTKWRNKFRSEGSDWRIKAIKLVNELNKRRDSSWYANIKMPNESAASGNFRTSANSFATSLKPVVTGVFEYNRDVDKNFLIVSNYWDCLREIFTDAFLKPKEYAIQKTSGLFPLHTLLQAILNKKGYEYGLDKNKLKNILKKVFDETETVTDFWRSDNTIGVTRYGSMKGFRLLSDEFIEALNKIE